MVSRNPSEGNVASFMTVKCNSLHYQIAAQLSDKELYDISKKIPEDKLWRIAAHFNMTADLHRIRADPSKSTSASFDLLYEWRRAKAGVRHKLVEALKELDLHQLALM